jgi:transposase-like protein
MSDFKWRHFEGEIILWAVRWYCRYGISYRDLEQMMGERGVPLDHSTIYRWVQKYAPEIEKRLRWQWRRPQSTSWRVDETYVKVRGRWTYLYRALDKLGNTIDFLSLAYTERQSGEALPRQGAECSEGVGTAGYHQHGQSADLRDCDFRTEGRR